jgi:hypothetical protein
MLAQDEGRSGDRNPGIANPKEDQPRRGERVRLLTSEKRSTLANDP